MSDLAKPYSAGWAQVALNYLSDLDNLADKGLYEVGPAHLAQFWKAAGVGEIGALSLAHDEVQKLLCFQRMSSLLLAFGVFEGGVNQLASEVLRWKQARLKLTDFHGNGLERAKLVLTKVGGFSHTFSTDAWREATAVAQLRNVVLHSGGVVANDSEKHTDILARKGVSRLHLTDNGIHMFSISQQYLVWANAAFSTALNDISREFSGALKC